MHEEKILGNNTYCLVLVSLLKVGIPSLILTVFETFTNIDFQMSYITQAFFLNMFYKTETCFCRSMSRHLNASGSPMACTWITRAVISG